MTNYIIRLDDYGEHRDVEKWNKMFKLLDKYAIKPVIGVIPNCQDKMFEKYPEDPYFWSNVRLLVEKGYHIAMHGYEHVYHTNDSGINPINSFSEFAGLSYNIQKEKIQKANQLFNQYKVKPTIFFAPGHTYDLNTVKALIEETNIRIISDTISSDIYKENGIVYIPVQSGRCRWLPVKYLTFALHPNTMKDSDYIALEEFILPRTNKFIDINSIDLTKVKEKSLYSSILSKVYFAIRKLRKRSRY